MIKKQLDKVPFSVLDLAAVLQDKTIKNTFNNSLDLALHAEQWGYERYWLAEHHNMETIASAATSVLIGFIAGGTKKIRVGSGGIMLPNDSSLVIAEQFGTLESLYPGRIDLGLGRAPGTDQLTAMALRRNRFSANDFPEQVQELFTYFSAANKTAHVRAIPGEGLDIPIWILGSSTDSAYLAASLGLPYAFASHFAPTYLQQALNIYRVNFKPSVHLQQPYTMAAINVMAADTNAEAAYIATSFYQLATGIIRGTRRPMQAPVNSMQGLWSPAEEAAVKQMMHYTFTGDAPTVKNQLQMFVNDTAIDEIMIVGHIYDHAAKLRSYELISDMTIEPVAQQTMVA
ncbi:MsnO8 family LLM class oxidoreductase [soil metagenome]